MSNTGHNTGGSTIVVDDYEALNRGPELITVSVVMTVFCTLVAVWRVAVRFRVSTWMGLSDWLMIGGVVSYSAKYSEHLANQGTTDIKFPGEHTVHHFRCKRRSGSVDGRSLVASSGSYEL